MKILALIPARGGSKRLPKKNIRVLGNKPLIVWSIDIAKEIPEICNILVSTDDPEIAEVADKSGALVPWLRPPELASDIASSVDVCLHALNWYISKKEPIDGLLLLQPTSPFRTAEKIREGIALFQENSCKTVISVSPTKSHPMWCFQIKNNSLHPFVNSKLGLGLRSQDLPDAYEVNGYLYIIKPQELYESKSFFSGSLIPLVIDSYRESIDIDTHWDWKIAECFLSNFKN